jgi:hypothetical protein
MGKEVGTKCCFQGPFRPYNRAGLPDALGCGCSSGVEHNLAKVGVEGSNPFARSKIVHCRASRHGCALRPILGQNVDPKCFSREPFWYNLGQKSYKLANGVRPASRKTGWKHCHLHHPPRPVLLKISKSIARGVAPCLGAEAITPRLHSYYRNDK